VDENMVGVCGRFTNKGETNYMGRTGVVKQIMMGDGERETNNCQNRPWNLHQAYPAHPNRVILHWGQAYSIHSDIQGVADTIKDGDSDGR
jgi:hypothetical protein